jgi:hypothetical protein
MKTTMTEIMNFVKNFSSSKNKNYLGRWSITYCKNTLNKRVDLANEDHCGVCYSTKYHNDAFIKQINHIKNIASDATTNANRLKIYMKNLNHMNKMKNNEVNMKNRTNKRLQEINRNPIIDLE